MNLPFPGIVKGFASPLRAGVGETEIAMIREVTAMLKRTLALVLSSLLFFSAANAQPIAVNFQDAAALIDYDGRELVAPGAFDYIFDLGGGAELYCAGGYVGEEFLYTLLDGGGKTLTEQIYGMFSYADGVVLFMRDGLYGAMNERGEALLPAGYTELVPNGEGGFLALKTDVYDDEPDGLYHIDESGAESATGVKTLGGLYGFSEGLMPLISAENGLFGYVDSSGQWAIRPQFSFAEWFIGGRALATLSTGYGIIDESGNWVLTPKYDYVSLEIDSPSVAVQDARLAIAFDPQSGRELFRIDGSNLSASAFAGRVQVGDTVAARLYDASGALLYEGSPLASYAAGEQGQSIVIDGNWDSDSAYLLGSDGKVVAGPYQDIFPLETFDGRGYYGYLRFDAAAAEAPPEDANDSDMGSARYGILGADGAEITPAQYEEMVRVAENRLLVRMDGTDGVADLNGNWIYRHIASGE